MLEPNIIVIGFLIFISLWILFLTLLILNYKRTYSEVTKGISKKDLKEILTNINKSLQDKEAQIEELKSSLDNLEKRSLTHVQKVGLLRYNPFSDTGGDQSFCVGLLDGKNNGIVITSLHSRDQTRIYAKPVTDSMASGYELSQEESKALKLALNQK